MRKGNKSSQKPKFTAGCLTRATAKSAFTIFSPSPIHLEVKELLEIEKKLVLHCRAIHLASSVLPVRRKRRRIRSSTKLEKSPRQTHLFRADRTKARLSEEHEDR
jgi:hypothetical protein